MDKPIKEYIEKNFISRAELQNALNNIRNRKSENLAEAIAINAIEKFLTKLLKRDGNK